MTEAAHSQERIHRLWDELADFPAAETDAALRHFMKTVCSWIGADNSWWAASVRVGSGPAAAEDPLCGWRTRCHIPLHGMAPAERRLLQRASRRQDIEPGLPDCATARRAGRFRVHRLRDGFVDFNAFRRTPYYQALYKEMRIEDRIWVCFPVNEAAESFFLFDKWRARDRFSAADAALAGTVLRGIKWFHRRLLLSHGGLAVAHLPMSPGQRKVLAALLTDKSEKQIAAGLGLAVSTTHKWVTEIFRRFGVQGRAGLMSLWLGRPE